MINILVHHKVEDYSKWKPFFDGHSTIRTQMGSKGGKVFRNANDPNDLFVLLEWDNIDNAQKFGQSDSLKEVMKKAGVITKPDVYFVEEIAETSN